MGKMDNVEAEIFLEAFKEVMNSLSSAPLVISEYKMPLKLGSSIRCGY
jgi:hypothetical protein